MKFVVAQIGARRGYAVPAILEKAGMLERFYTDLSGQSFTTRALKSFSEKARRLAARRVPKEIRHKTVTFPTMSLGHFLRRGIAKHDLAARFREAMRFSDALGRAMAHRGFGNATHIYSMLGECGPLLVAGKERGLTIVSEVYILLSTERILAEERAKFPDWERDIPDFAAIRRQVGAEDVLLTRSDYFICPSEAVRDDLVEHFGIAVKRTAVVPYGVSSEVLSVSNNPIRGRILFGGTAELRKGIHYFAMASEELVKRGCRYEFRVAGDVRLSVSRQQACRHITFLGRLPRSEMTDEFEHADIFVLPSLAEGSAEVIYEALACGIPVVTTAESGSVVRDNIEGRIVPSSDPDALGDAISSTIEDRQLRQRMGNAARERSREFTWKRYGERFVTALQSFSK